MTLMQEEVTWALSVVVALFIGGFLKSYMGKKGENLATKEDIARLTWIQEEIKTRLSESTWSRQRQWELQRDVACEFLGSYGALFDKLQDFSQATIERSMGENNPDAAVRHQATIKRDSAYRAVADEITRFVKPRETSRLVFSEDIFLKAQTLQVGFATLMQEMNTNCRYTKEYAALFKKLVNLQEELSKALRREMGISLAPANEVPPVPPIHS
jgi:hypothetical protein